MYSLLHTFRVPTGLQRVMSQVIKILLQTLDLKVATLVLIGLLSLQCHNFLVFGGDRVFADGQFLFESVYLQMQDAG